MISPRPILIFGLPRSGISWIARIFDSHPDTIYRHEPDKRFRDSELPVSPGTADLTRDKALAYVEACLALSYERTAGSPPFFKKSYRSAAADKIHVAIILMMKGISRLAPQLANIVPIPDLIARNNRGFVRTIWKSALGITQLPDYARLMPDARCLLVMRHPGGQIASIMRGRAEGHLPGRDIPIAISNRSLLEPIVLGDIGKRACLCYEQILCADPFEQEAFNWALLNQFAIDGVAELSNCRVVRYEDIAMDPEPNARELFAFAGLDWNDQTERFIQNSTRTKTRGSTKYFSLYRDAQRSVDRWRAAFTPEQLHHIRTVVSWFPVGQFYADTWEQ